jgi:isocitrate dehydrogenase kinase/phosphatase
VGPNDIFPEEFSLFFSGNQRAREVFDTLHSEIYEAAFWQDLQKKIHAGYLEEFFPYRRELRFDRNRKPAMERA